MSITLIKIIVIIIIIVIGTLIIPIIRHNTKMPAFVAIGMLAAIAAVVRYKPEQETKEETEDKHKLDKRK